MTKKRENQKDEKPREMGPQILCKSLFFKMVVKNEWPECAGKHFGISFALEYTVFLISSCITSIWDIWLYQILLV